MKLRLLSLAIALLASLSPLHESLAAPQNLEDSFLSAREAFRVGDRAKLERLSTQLETHELKAYIDYWRLVLDLNTREPATIQAFLKAHDKTYIAERLRSDWLKLSAKKRDWLTFDAEYPALQQPDPELTCYALQRRYAQKDPGFFKDALPLWLTLIEPPEPCYPVLEALIIEKKVLGDDVWARIRRQFEAGKLTAGRYSMHYLPANQTPDMKLAQDVSESPLPWLIGLSEADLSKKMNQELAALAIQRIARNDPRMAAQQLSKIERHLAASPLEFAWSQIGWQAALRHMADAEHWFKRAGAAPLSPELLEWKVRAALRAGQWGTVRATIEKMPPTLKEDPTWIYWLGRAYRAAKKEPEAKALFSKIAGQPHFYGNLADEELGLMSTVPPNAAPPTPEEIARVESMIGLKRALTLLRLGLRIEGVREWNFAIRGMNDRDLLAAADFAKRSVVYDRAISTADRTKTEHNFELRYPTPFSVEVRAAAKAQSLDDAWVFGLMRQESRFIMNARSSVGASGLMQLMPATARWVAKKIGLKDFHLSQVNDLETNLLLGTSYMQMVMDNLDHHQVLVSAAYNAGPGRALRWRGERPLEGAIYAETIPFNETRDYVKRVMSNALYYAALFEGRPQSIKKRLTTTPAKTAHEPQREALP